MFVLFSISVRFYSSIYFIRFSMNILSDFSDWWAQVDSNHRPRAYQARALTTWAMSPLSYLPVYLFPLSPMVEMMGFEPMTPCLQGRCSPNWATPPFLGVSLLLLSSLLVTQNWTTSESYLASLCTNLRLCRDFALLYEYEISQTPFADLMFSIERRWSSRTFRYGYLVTT